MKRVIIIGNSGSGKSFLSEKISVSSGLPVISLDQLFWVPGGFSEKRPEEIVYSEIDVKKNEAQWIVEGVFGELAERFIDHADYLIWLDLSWAACRDGLLQRGSESSKQLDPASAEANFQKLIVWAENYWSRTDLRSHSGHRSLFEKFQGAKDRLTDRKSVDGFLGQNVP